MKLSSCEQEAATKLDLNVNNGLESGVFVEVTRKKVPSTAIGRADSAQLGATCHVYLCMNMHALGQHAGREEG